MSVAKMLPSEVLHRSRVNSKVVDLLPNLNYPCSRRGWLSDQLSDSRSEFWDFYFYRWVAFMVSRLDYRGQSVAMGLRGDFVVLGSLQILRCAVSVAEPVGP